jgi:hypothetical protein
MAPLVTEDLVTWLEGLFPNTLPPVAPELRADQRIAELDRRIGAAQVVALLRRELDHQNPLGG